MSKDKHNEMLAFIEANYYEWDTTDESGELSIYKTVNDLSAIDDSFVDTVNHFRQVLVDAFNVHVSPSVYLESQQIFGMLINY